MDYHHLLTTPCATPAKLHAWVRLFTGLDVPTQSVCAGHAAPFDYLKHAYFEPSRDVVIWAPRGGGKTRLAAVATLLDLLHKPGCQVRILGGSLEQSMKMWDYLLPDLHKLARRHLQRAQQRRLALDNGGGCAVLTQSQKAVRGLRVQKLRCDEVELFDPDVWEAGQLVTRSNDTAAGVVEALSTFHAVGGLMGRIVDDAHAAGTPVLRWCLLDVLQKCEPERDCETCPLWDDCGGVAKSKCNGFVPIDDAIAMKRRVSSETWESEMLCRRPSVKGRVFPSFDSAVHVAEFEPPEGRWLLGVDFGFAAPLVALWLVDTDTGIYVVDEHVAEQRTLDEHIAAINDKPWPAVELVGCDPAGKTRNSHTATSDVGRLRSAGFDVRCKPSRIGEGLEQIRQRLRTADGEVRLHIHRRCTNLIRCMAGYRYPDHGGELPLKDGVHDHCVDALRYALINRGESAAIRRGY
ncbi:MAG: hypothetical protein AAGD32_16615 [Planctomycetota bacterium]